MQYVRKYAPVCSIFCLALLVRLLYNITVAHGYVPKYDAALYDIIAQNLVTQHCFCRFSHHATVSRAPLWPFVMAIVYFFTGGTALHFQNAYPRLFYCFLGSGTCVLVYLFARDLFGKRIALCCGVLAAIYTGLFIYDGWLFSESLYTFLLTALTYTLYRLQRTIDGTERVRPRPSFRNLLNWSQLRGQRRWIILSGLALGLASLARPNGPVLFGLLLLWGGSVIVSRHIPWQMALRAMLLIAVIALAIIAPWTYRNYRVTHAFIPVALGMGDVMLGSYNDTVLTNASNEGPGYWVPRSMIPAAPIQHCQDCYNHDSYNYTINNENTDNAYALHWIMTHLSDMPYLFFQHFVHMWKAYTLETALPVKEFPQRQSSQIVWSLMLTMPYPVFFLAAFGLLVTWRRWHKQLILVYWVLLLTTAQNLATYANMRFRAPIEPLLVLLVGGTLWWLTSRKPGTFLHRRRMPATTDEGIYSNSIEKS